MTRRTGSLAVLGRACVSKRTRGGMGGRSVPIVGSMSSTARALAYIAITAGVLATLIAIWPDNMGCGEASTSDCGWYEAGWGSVLWWVGAALAWLAVVLAVEYGVARRALPRARGISRR